MRMGGPKMEMSAIILYFLVGTGLATGAAIRLKLDGELVAGPYETTAVAIACAVFWPLWVGMLLAGRWAR